MTRLTTDDIQYIADRLPAYDRELEKRTGRSLLSLACHACRVSPAETAKRIQSFQVAVVPVTAGLGTISTFSDTVCAVLQHLGFESRVTEACDIAGIADAVESGCDGLMMSDDQRFIGLNPVDRRVADNSRCTGRGYAAALDLMAGGVTGKPVLVMGCGPVGAAAAEWLCNGGADVSVYDIRPDAAIALADRLPGISPVSIKNLAAVSYGAAGLVDATPVSGAISDDLILDHSLVAAPGVPLGVSSHAVRQLGRRLVHDKLEIGTAVMAVEMCGHLNRLMD